VHQFGFPLQAGERDIDVLHELQDRRAVRAGLRASLTEEGHRLGAADS